MNKEINITKMLDVFLSDMTFYLQVFQVIETLIHL